MSRDVLHYSLEAILAVGYRVRSQRGTQFRQWATARLQGYLVKGFVLDDERLKNPPAPGVPDYFDELLERIREIRASERRMYLRVREILALAADYDPRDEEAHAPEQTPAVTIAYDPGMTTIIGADGCHTGWLCIFEELPTRRIGSKIFPTIADLLAAAPTLELLAIDIPIGLTDAGPRDCDIAARKFLGPNRGSSVFPAPIRPALHAASYPDACEASFKAQQKMLSKQSWAIYPKIRELDHLLRTRPDLRDRVYEVHPEVTFAAWNGTPIADSKKKHPGFTARHDLVTRHFGPDTYKTVRARYPRKEAADDDILDAFAALWTAERIVRGEAQSLPAKPAVDAEGLPMRMVY